MDDDGAMAWIEQVAQFFARQEGLPPITGRILGYLMICEPPEQSASEIASAIKASRASMTSNIRTLLAVGLIRRRTRAGERTAYYRIDDEAWEAAVRHRIQGMAEFEHIAAEGLDLLGADTARASRLRAAYDVYQWVGRLLTLDALQSAREANDTPARGERHRRANTAASPTRRRR